MDRVDFYFRQRVEDDEMDQVFDFAENADKFLASDHKLKGIQTGLAVNPAGPPDLTVDIGAGTAYSKTGERLRAPSLSNVDVSVDSLGQPTVVVGGGNEKIVSLFISFLRNESDPRTDGNGAPLNYLLEESFRIRVVQGVEAASPIAPTLDVNDILLADIRLSFGTIVITGTEIETGRREWGVNFNGINLTLNEGTANEAIVNLASQLDAVIETITIPASMAPNVSGVVTAGAVGLTDGGRVYTGTVGPNVIAVPLLGLKNGDRIISVTGNYTKITNLTTASMRLSEFDLTKATVNSLPTISSFSAGAVPITINDTTDAAWFPESDNTRLVTAGNTYWCEMTDGDNGDSFVAVEVTYKRSSV